MKNSFEEYYKKTTYRVYVNNDIFIDLFIDKVNLDIISLLNKYNSNNAIFVTAYNPFSKILTKEENEKRLNNLVDEIKSLGLTFFYGDGIGFDRSWEPEKSLLVLDVKANVIDYLLDKYQQNAIVIVDKSGLPTLYWNKSL